MKIERGEHVTVLGKTGSGKTFYVRNALLPAFSRVIVIDSEEYDFNDFPIVSNGRAMHLAKSEYAFIVRVVPPTDESVEELCALLLKKGHDTAIYFDEVTDFSDAYEIPEQLRRLIRKGRKRGLNVIVGTQRPQMLSKDFLANTVHRVYFALSDYDFEHVKAYAPFLKERMAEIPYKSWKSLYENPAGEVAVLGPAEPYDWGPRLKPKRIL